MTRITVSSPAGGRAVFTRRSEGATSYWATDVPGHVDVPPLTGDGFFQVTLRAGGSASWSDTFAVRPPASGTHNLEDLERLPLGEAAAGGFVLGERLSTLESTVSGLEDSSDAVQALQALLSDVDALEVDTGVGTLISLNGVPVFYDSGWRDFSQYLDSNLLGGTFLVRRTLTDLYFSFSGIELPPGSGFHRVAFGIPMDWRPRDDRNGFVIARSNNSSYRQYMSTVGGSIINWIGESHPQSESPPTGVRPPVGLTGSWTFAARAGVPTSLPGDPA